MSTESRMNYSVYPIYCPVCGDDGDNSSTSLELGSRTQTFQCFLKLFGVKWGGNAFSFCEECRCKVTLISVLQRELQKLQQKLTEVGKELENKLESSEATFERRSLYSWDQRYLKLRKQILGDKISQSEPTPNDYLNGSRCGTEESDSMEFKTEAFEHSEQVLEDPLAFITVAHDPLDPQRNDRVEGGAEEDIELERVIKLEEFNVENEEELIPDNEEEIESPISSSDHPSTSDSFLNQLINPSPTMVNFPSCQRECPACGKISRNSALLQVHYRYRHHPINCTLCGKTLKGSRLFHQHMSRVHSNGGNNETPHHLQCEVCGRTFNNTAMKSQHLAQHSGANFSCPDCGMTYRWASGLAKHHRERCSTAANRKLGDFPCAHQPISTS